MIDWVYVDGEAGPEFVPAPPLSDDDVQQIVETTARPVVRLLQRRGLLEEGNTDPLMAQEPLLATITAASIQGQVATGERAGQPVRRRLLDPLQGIRTCPLCFAARGFSLHAATPCRPPTAQPGKTVPVRQSTAVGGGTPADPGRRESGQFLD